MLFLSMALLKISKYWLYQFVGWGINLAVSVFIMFSMGKATPLYYKSLALTILLGVFITHIMRYQMKQMKILTFSIKGQVWRMLLVTVIYSFIFGVSSLLIDYSIGEVFPERFAKLSYWMRLFLYSFNCFWLLLIWNVIYFVYHYAEKNRMEQLNTLKLEATVKELELKTIKSHINPHFIFNSLNSIRALVDENPTRARQAITELSNILRSSMRAEKQETVPFSQELGIVNDYLALEYMRFEERLDIDMNIGQDTLEQQVPPMMIQTLVENAIKHGISKQIEGGTISLSSSYVDDEHLIEITNTGTLSEDFAASDGFGLQSTEDRLNLMYNGKANFKIIDNQNNTVTCKVVLPKTVAL